MKVYLVGGAIRDQLLGYPVRERDWVVVGGTPEALINQGFQQVGRDFPVFLHPKTREEYALARIERKQTAGYYGFRCDFNPEVTLEEDLARRDLTINAMAMDDSGTIIDPFDGQAALREKILQHVSPAFVEDPVRVLRVARFAARFHHLGFSVADETRCLMNEMVKQGEVSHLVPERVWQEFQRSLSEKNPEQFITVLRNCGALRVVIPEFDRLFGIPNLIDSPHSLVGEGERVSIIDSGLQALDALKKIVLVSESPVLRFAALFHNIGNICTPIADWPTHRSTKEAIHQQIATLCLRLRVPKEYSQLAQMTAQFYRTIQQLPMLTAETIVTTLEQCDAFRRPENFAELLLICDAIACHPSQQQAKYWQIIAENCGKITAKSLIAQGCEGRGIKSGLHQKRVEFVGNNR